MRGVEVTGARLPSAQGEEMDAKLDSDDNFDIQGRFQSMCQIRMRFRQLLGRRQSGVLLQVKEGPEAILEMHTQNKDIQAKLTTNI